MGLYMKVTGETTSAKVNNYESIGVGGSSSSADDKSKSSFSFTESNYRCVW